MKILVLNCGSSSIKYQLVDMTCGAEVLAKGVIERIGLSMGELTHKYRGQKHSEQLPVPDHVSGIKVVLSALTSPKIGVIGALEEIGAVGNRIVFGGRHFKESCIVTDKVVELIESIKDVFPLHLPGNLAGIRAMEAALPGIPQVAVFDTAFHATMPPKAYLYGLPYAYAEKYDIRRYGFHGTSHRFVAEKAASMVGKDWKEMKIISCHLGSGASICAVDRGQSVDTTLGMTPVEGLIMGSRCGDVDAGAVLYLMEKEGIGVGQMSAILNKKSGLLGISGDKQDMRDIYAAKESGDLRATHAFEAFAYRVKKYIGAYMAAMNGCDLLLLTGGIGENAWFMRRAILEEMEFLGIVCDLSKNDGVMGKDIVLSVPDSRVAVVVVTTDEERVIAEDTYRLVMGRQ